MPSLALDWDRSDISGHYIIRNMTNGFQKMIRDKATLFYFSFLIFILLLGLVGPIIAPYEPTDRMRTDDGELIRTTPPSLENPLGTTKVGYDVLSRLLYGARPTIVAGVLGGVLIASIGVSIGVTAGYVGGWVENLAMRITDLFYGVPLIPFAIILIAFFGTGYLQSILVIALVLWRGSARVLRSQVLQIKERPYILASKASGASTTRIIIKHIIPNVAPMGILFLALGIGYTIIIQAGLAFLGVVNPFVPSWGVMVRNAYNSGLMGTAWWWSIPPSLLIAITVLSTFMFGRSYEALTGQTDESLAQVG